MEDLVKKIVKEKQPFERLVMKKSDLLEMFKYNEFKIRILNEKVRPLLTFYMRQLQAMHDIEWPFNPPPPPTTSSVFSFSLLKIYACF